MCHSASMRYTKWLVGLSHFLALRMTWMPLQILLAINYLIAAHVVIDNDYPQTYLWYLIHTLPINFYSKNDHSWSSNILKCVFWIFDNDPLEFSHKKIRLNPEQIMKQLKQSVVNMSSLGRLFGSLWWWMVENGGLSASGRHLGWPHFRFLANGNEVIQVTGNGKAAIFHHPPPKGSK